MLSCWFRGSCFLLLITDLAQFLFAQLVDGQLSANNVIGNSIFPRPRITEVSAMCTPEGITAMIMFDGQFMGRIYSERYGTTHDCIYYNGYDMNMILFSVPNFKCGTRVTRSGQNLIQRIENEIYIQWDKDTQNADDRRYLFICESRTGPIDPGGFPNPNRPVFPLPNPNGNLFPTPLPPFPQPNPNPNPNPNGIIPDFSGTISPDQTIIIQTGRPTEVIGQGNIEIDPNIYMEIQDGYGPDRPPVARVVELGEIVTLVVGGRIPDSNPRFDMKVHSCFATDGTGNTKVELIDVNGCPSRESIAQPMQKRREQRLIVLYTPIKAFKFPSSEDVYFTCSVDACSACEFPPPCAGRGKRSVDADNEDLANKLELFQSLQISRPPSAESHGRNGDSATKSTSVFNLCLNGQAFAALMTLIALSLAAFVTMGVYVVKTERTKKKLPKTHTLPTPDDNHDQAQGRSYF